MVLQKITGFVNDVKEISGVDEEKYTLVSMMISGSEKQHILPGHLEGITAGHRISIAYDSREQHLEILDVTLDKSVTIYDGKYCIEKNFFGK